MAYTTDAGDGAAALDAETGLPIDFLTAQPYPLWADARQAGCPVVRTDRMSTPGRPGYQIVTFDEAVAALRDPETFSSAINMEHIGEFMGELIVGLDGEEHRTYRNIVAHAFRRSQIEHWDAELVTPTIHRLLDEIAPLGRADLVATVTSRYPVWIICGIVGVPIEDAEQFHRWSEQINTGPLNPPQGHAAVKAMTDYLTPLVEDRRANPRGDLLSELVHTEIDGEALSDARLWGFLRLLLPAGAETTYRVMGNLLHALLTHPDEMERVRADRSLLPTAIEETLRWETSVTMVARVATRATEVAGCPIPEGASVGVVTASANHDEDRFDEPEEWRLDRGQFHHLAFGTGPHQCLGMHLARLELETGVNAVLDRLPGLRLDPDAPAPVIEGMAFRGPNALPARWDV
jgi:cytochrome P450